MITSAPLWSVLLVPAVLAAFAAVAVTADALLAAHAAGRPLRAAVAAGPLAEVPRLLAGQRRSTLAPDALLWRLGVLTIPAAGVLAALVIPFGDVTASRMSVGVVWFNAMEVLTWAGLWMAGWGANSALSLAGGYRFVAQGLAYELPLMFALIAAAAGAQSLNVADIVAAQSHLWFAVWMPAAFLIYLVSAYAFSFLGPFAYPAGRDLAGGVLAELSGADRLALEAGRWLLLTAGAGMAVPLFLGGGAGPVLPAWAWSAAKTLAVLALLVWARRRLPVLRADRYATRSSCPALRMGRAAPAARPASAAVNPALLAPAHAAGGDVAVALLVRLEQPPGQFGQRTARIAVLRRSWHVPSGGRCVRTSGRACVRRADCRLSR